ncbi:MAG: hypothetical protein GF309_14200 [Candidatus Lokiarchaeota archaeon]|nr:hypothetical protein [Candidatus Lokiarchaeota archaeon]
MEKKDIFSGEKPSLNLFWVLGAVNGDEELFVQIIVVLLVGLGLGAFVTQFYYTSTSLSTTNLPTSKESAIGANEDNWGIGDISVVEVSVSEQDLKNILTEIESWKKKQLERFFRNFLREREIDILEALAKAFLVDGKPKHTHLKEISKGWMNRHQIHLESGVSRKVIYKRAGVMDRLITVGLVLMTKRGTWGRGKYEYRLNTENAFVSTYAEAVLRASA